MQRHKFQNHGWAAFDRKHRRNESSGAENEVDPYPSISDVGHVASSTPRKSFMPNNFSMKSFSSVVRPSLDLPVLARGTKLREVKESSITEHHDHQVQANVPPAIKLLKDIHSWADQNLIEDILAGVNNDVDQASLLLKAMVSPQSNEEVPNCQSSSSENYQIEEEDFSMENKRLGDTEEVLLTRKLISVPDETEWQEDDIYLIHRKDAMKMMRAASQHSRAASNAFVRGDHVSAHQLSLRAREEWLAAEKLNNKAADEILRIRNSTNDIWKIDLHGLHATEAVIALKDRLHKIESEMVMKHSASSEELAKLEANHRRSPSLEPVKVCELDLMSRKPIPQQRQTILQVITGSGKHSKGEAHLPIAVRSFLLENGYRFDDARPGVFAVRPKFRHK